MRRLLLAFLVTAAPSGPPSLAVYHDGAWHEWWREDRAPAVWRDALPMVHDAIAWDDSADGLAVGSLRLSGSGEAWRIRAIVVTVDPGRVRFALAGLGARRGPPYDWTVRSAPRNAALALNAGQFNGKGPWGWIVESGRELQAPGAGPLAPAVVVDTGGDVRFVPPDSIPTARKAGGIRLAFQSWPTLLAGDGEVPAALRQEGAGLDLRHRDARLALGMLRDGRLIIVMTRFEGLGGVLESLPFGLTTQESAALLGALGARQAVLLDGGTSSQLLVRIKGRTHQWTGLRYVPMGLVGRPAGG